MTPRLPYEPPTVTLLDAVPEAVVVVFEAYAESAYRHDCGAMVTRLPLCETPQTCTRCGRTT